MLRIGQIPQDRCAFAINPEDNDAAGQDSNPALGVIEVVAASKNFFDVQIRDTSDLNGNNQGSGIATASVSPESILLYKDGNVLVEGVDYRFGFDATSNIIRLTPLAGIWEADSVYQIRFINKNESSITVVDPRSIVDGTTYTILDANSQSTYFELDTGLRVKVPQTADGFTNAAVDGSSFTIDDGSRRVVFEFDNDSKITDGHVQVRYDSQDTPEVFAQKVVAAIRSVGLNLTVKTLGSGEFQILGSNVVTLIPDSSKLSVSGKSGVTPLYGFQIPTENGLPKGVKDGQTFTIQRGSNTVVFEFDENGAVGTNNVRVPLNNASIDGLALGMVNAINSAGLGLTATAGAGGFVFVGTDSDVVVQATNTVLQVVGVRGRPAPIAIPIDLSVIATSSQAASLINDAIVAQNLAGVETTLLGSRIFIEGARGVAGLGAHSVSGIRDEAGNAMRATEIDGKTLLTIFLGSGYDYGDAPDPTYASKKSSGGPRHKVVEGMSIGPTVTADADARLPYADTDDGVSFTQFVTAFTSTVTVNVQGVTLAKAGYINAWVDFNGNGIFESSEQIISPATSGRIANGDNVFDNIRIPSNAVTNKPVDMRVRFSSEKDLGPNGDAIDGEVEDYAITIQRNPYTNPTNALDVNGDGGVSPIDVLILVNYINANSINTHLPPAGVVPPYLDVDGDGFVGPQDVLTVINYINRNSNGGGSSGGEGEGFDQWVAAPSVAAPAVESRPSTTSAVASTNGVTNHAQSLDQFLAQLAPEMGPALSSDEIDWSYFGSSTKKTKSGASDSALTVAIDDLMSDWLM